MSENTKDWHVTLTVPAYLSYTVEADDEESAIEEVKQLFSEGGEPYDLEFDDEPKVIDAYVLTMY